MSVCNFKLPVPQRFRVYHRKQAANRFIERQKQQKEESASAAKSAAAKARTRLTFNNAGLKTNMPTAGLICNLKRSARTRQPTYQKDFLCFA